MIITRKIQVIVNESDKESKEEFYSTLFSWAYMCRNAANILASHLFFQENVKNFFYLKDDIRLQLSDSAKQEKGIFSTSHQNTGYQILSKLYKGKLNTEILTSLNQNIFKNFREEKTEYFKGTKSLRSYKNNIPIPITRKKFLRTITVDYNFSFYGIPLKIIFGKDLSGNQIIVDRVISGEYRMSNSSIYYDKKKNKWFLLFTVDIPQKIIKLKDKELYGLLSINTPIIAVTGVISDKSKVSEIGTKDEFLYRRIAIQGKRSRIQKELKYCNGGHGRSEKLRALERFKKIEKNYVTTKMHQYSKHLIDIAIKNATKTIILVKVLESEEIKEEPFLLRNWSYYNLEKFIVYKAKKYGIEVKIQSLKYNDYGTSKLKEYAENVS